MPAYRRSSVATAAMCVAVVAWGLTGVLVKLTTQDALAVSLYRLWLGFAAMVVPLYVTGGRLSMRIVRRAAVGGVLLGFDVALFFTALKLTSVANATLVASLQPLLVLVVAGPMFGERVGAREVALGVVAMAGVGLVVVGSTTVPAWRPAGDLVAFGALLAWTGYFVATKRARDTLSPLEYMTGAMLVSAIVVTPMAVLSGQSLALPVGDDWVWLAILVLVPGALGHLLASWAHAHVDVTVSSLLALGVPIVTAVSGLFVLHEPLRALQVAGGAVVLVAIGGVVVRPSATVVEPETVL